MRTTLYNGDALVILPQLAADKFDMIIADPPYSSGGLHRHARIRGLDKYLSTNWTSFSGDNRDQRSYLAWCNIWMSGAMRVTKPGGMLCCFSDWRQLPLISDAIQVAGWIWQGILVWDKGAAVRPQLGRYRNQCEYVLWATKGTRQLTGPVAAGVVLSRTLTARDKVHPTQKPMEVLNHLLTLVPPGGEVLDPFMGSGSTLLAALAAKKTGIHATGIELSTHYFNIAEERLNSFDNSP